MKKPKLSDLKVDESGTQKIRNRMAKASKIKITVNIDSDVVSKLKQLSAETGVPYQNLLNKLLRESLGKSHSQEARLSQLEREVAMLKEKVSA